MLAYNIITSNQGIILSNVKITSQRPDIGEMQVKLFLPVDRQHNDLQKLDAC